MRNAKIVTALALYFVAGTFAGHVFTSAIVEKMTERKFSESYSARSIEPQPQASLSRSAVSAYRHHNGPDEAYHGAWQQEGLSIAWRGQSNYGADVGDVVEAAIDRLNFEQQTADLASNDKAQALIALIEAKNLLAGKQPETTTDGTPIIE